MYQVKDKIQFQIIVAFVIIIPLLERLPHQAVQAVLGVLSGLLLAEGNNLGKVASQISLAKAVLNLFHLRNVGVPLLVVHEFARKLAALPEPKCCKEQFLSR
jgi:hypothetical protein